MLRGKSSIRPAVALWCLLVLTFMQGCDSSDYGINITLNTNAQLSVLGLTTVDLDQQFQAGLFNYTASVSVLTSSVTVSASAQDANATVRVDGLGVGAGGVEVDLGIGDNTITILVTAEDGITTAIYVVVVTRQSPAALAQQAYVKASNTGAADEFGHAIAASGNTLAIGAPEQGGSGAVYVFVSDPAGVWTEQAVIKAPNAEEGDNFGSAVALSGDTLAVGAGGEDSSAAGVDGDQADNSADGAGAAYVFTRDLAGAWTQQAYIKASNSERRDWFGYSVALEGDRLAVGAVKEDGGSAGINGDETDNSIIDSGAVYVFTRDATNTWSQQAYVKASNPSSPAHFGNAVALSGDTLAVGAFLEDLFVEFSGAAYTFVTDGAGAWSEQVYIKAPNAGAGDEFGTSIALSGDTLAVGARCEASAATGIDGDQGNDDAPCAGAVYVFERDGAGDWPLQAYVKASNTESFDKFGISIALSEFALAVGAVDESGGSAGINGDDSDNTVASAGAVYLFTRDIAGDWSQQVYVKASNPDLGDNFGNAVAFGGTFLVVAAHHEASAATGIGGDQSDNSAPESGAVYVFR